MAISSQNALLNQYAPPFCIGSPVNGEALLYNGTKKVWENRPITTGDLANVVPVDLVWEGDTFAAGDVVTISSDLQTFVSVPRADFGNPSSLNDLSDVDLIAPLLDGEVLTFNNTTNMWTNETAGGAGAVDSVFGRTGVVIAAPGDYNTTFISNQSTVTGGTATTALNTLNTLKADKVVGATAGNLAGLDGNGNLTDSGIDPNDLTNLVQIGDPNTVLANTAGYITLAQVPAAPVTSVYGRTGVVTAQAGDYSAFYATTAQGVLADSAVQPGDDVSDLVNDAGYITIGDVPPAPVLSVFGRFGSIGAEEGDYSIGQMSDVDSTGVAIGQILEWNGTNFVPGNKGASGSTTFIGLTDTPVNYTGSADKLVAVNSAGDALVFIDAPQNAPVDSVFGRTGIVVAAAGDYSAFYATTAQGVLADSAVQPGDNVSELVNDEGYITAANITGKADKIVPASVGNFAGLNATGNLIDSGFRETDFATAAQGTLADSAVQPGDNITTLTNNAGFIANITGESIGDLSDVDTTGIAIGQILEWDGTEFIAGDKAATGSTTFIGLSDTPVAYTGAAGQLVIVNPAGDGLDFISVSGIGDVDSVFGRIGDVVAVSGDYDTDLVTNVSTVTGATTTNALETLDQGISDNATAITGKADKAAPARVGNFAALDTNGNIVDSTYWPDDFATSAQGDLADTALQSGDNISELVNDAGYLTSAPVTSVDGRTGVVTLGDLYATFAQGATADTAIQPGDNNSTLTNDAGFITLAQVPADAVTSVFGRTGVVTALAGDYDSTEITNDSTVTGATVTAALETLNSNLGEDNTASNVGAGDGIFAQKNGVDLEFKTLVEGTNITLTSDGTTITIDAAGGASGEVNTASNVGAGEGVFAQKSVADLEFKSLVAGTNVTLSSDADEITINAASASSTLQTIRVNYNGFGTISSVQDATAGITGTTIDTGQWINFTFSADHPPASIIYYGYKDLGANGWGYKQTMPAAGSTSNEVLTGGSSGSPAQILTSMTNGTIRLQCRNNETLADAGQHAYIFFLF